jgi:hypothetical protein
VDRYQYVLETGEGMNHSKVLQVFPRGSQPDLGDKSGRTYYQVLGTEDMTAGVIAAGGTVVDTFHLNNMDLQFAPISNAATIITGFGSAYCVNGLFVTSFHLAPSKPVRRINDIPSIDEHPADVRDRVDLG